MKNKTSKKKNVSTSNKDLVGVIEMEGEIEEALPSTMFKVKCDNRYVVATISGRLRVNNIRLVPGDHVMVEVSVYDLTKGRIVWRK